MTAFVYRTWHCQNDDCHVETSSAEFASEHNKIEGHEMTMQAWMTTYDKDPL